MNLNNTILTVNILPIYLQPSSFWLRYLMSEWSINIQIPHLIWFVGSHLNGQLCTQNPHTVDVDSPTPVDVNSPTPAQLCAQVLSRGDTSLPSSISHPPRKWENCSSWSLKLLTNQILLFCFHLAVNTCTVRLQYTDEVVSVNTKHICSTPFWMWSSLLIFGLEEMV